MSEVVLQGVTKRYGSYTAVDNIDLVVREGEFVTLLGPSGCGKTTTLRIVAGFVHPSSGDVFIGGRRVTNVASNRRNTGLVFQNFALFPHLTVAQNVAFGLKVRKVNSTEIGSRVEEALSLVHLEGYEDRLPRALSGGQQQRVALARAVVIRPQVLLLDEPLSALDLKLRQELQVYIKEIQTALKITTIYVTHDQGEALRLSDRIVVMRAGRIVQMALPFALYKSPATAFVANFVGEMNLLPVKVSKVEGEVAHCRLAGDDANHLDALIRTDGGKLEDSEGILLGFRPETATLERLEGNSLRGVVKKVEYQGPSWAIVVGITDAAAIRLEIPATMTVPKVGEGVTVYWRVADCFVFAKESLKRNAT